MKKRILFVDDEPSILEGLRNRLRRLRDKWDMSFAESGQEALEILATESFDVLVTDMRMPQMDGAALLEIVQEKHPGVVRIVLSGYAELETALKAVPVAHQFLTKPCEAGLLENVVDRACKLQVLINDDLLRCAVGQIETLPSLPGVYSQLMAALVDENVSIEKVAKILEQDMAMCAKLLQIVNSAFFRLSRTITQVADAVKYLGFNTVKQLALAVKVFERGSGRARRAGFCLGSLQQHSLLVAAIASRMLDDKAKREDVFVAALLHDIGKLMLVMELPERFKEVSATMKAEGGLMHEVEVQRFGVTHAELGAYLLGIWGLPYPVVEAVAFHHSPGQVDQQEFDILAAVHVADALANEQMEPVLGDAAPLDLAYLSELGVDEDQLEKWRELARDQAEQVSSGPQV